MLLLFSRSTRIIFCVALFAVTAGAQSSDQLFPTPVYSNEISGNIAARRIGDNRLTRYFYTFNASQGDLFMNVVTQNFSGDIDVFIADTMQSVGKIIIYADTSRNETGRLIYFRKPEKLLLRIEGRTPSDEPATFVIKFAGSFVASTESGKDAVEAPTIRREVAVSRVETAVVRAPEPAAKPAEEKADTAQKQINVARPQARNSERPAQSPIRGRTPPRRQPSAAAVKAPSPPKDPKAADPKQPATAKSTARPGDSPATIFDPKKAEAEVVDPMAGIVIRIVLKDGRVIENRMSEVQSFSFDRGQLTVRTKDGKVNRYALLDVATFTIE
ncbi:MAG: hypothetical protein IPM50_01165 [Acidobacteriota bacterium]|nr:MAG: hypothetical protein IPM50_01165 [Acidobacteriota bacterium]